MVKYYASIADSRQSNTTAISHEETLAPHAVTSLQGPAVASFLKEGGTESTTHARVKHGDGSISSVKTLLSSGRRLADLPDLSGVAASMNAEVISSDDLNPTNRCRVTAEYMAKKVAELSSEYDNFFVVNLGAVV